MPVLSNARWERFAQGLASGMSATEAYAAAGYRPDDGNCCRLTGKDRIRGRVAELQALGAEKAEITLRSLLAEAEEARALAMRLGQPGAAVAAIKEKGILSGLRVEKQERKNLTEATRLSDDELEAIAAGHAAPVRFPGTSH